MRYSKIAKMLLLEAVTLLVVCWGMLTAVSAKPVLRLHETEESSQFAGLLQATQGMIHVGELSDVTPEQVRESRTSFLNASQILEPFKEVLDLWTSQYFDNTQARNLFLTAGFPEIRQGWQEEIGASANATVSTAHEVARDKRFFHWELEFPEVFSRKDGRRRIRGLMRWWAKGIFFYFKARRKNDEGSFHFWRYYALNTKRSLDNRLLISNLIACRPDPPRVVADCDIFALHDKFIEDILESHCYFLARTDAHTGSAKSGC
ncbi:MAG: hypothetical protein ACE5IY_16895 [bacterium]